VSYYTDTVAAGVEDYYAGAGEAPGAWLGRGAATEGLVGEVSAEQLGLLFEGRHPRSGEPLGAAYVVRAGVDRVTGWDLTFSAPKSVSTLWAVGGDGVGGEVRQAHDVAVQAALVYLEEHAAFSRTGKAGVRQVDTHGLVAAGFVHRTSRAGDPQLHTHVLVSGRVRCVDDGVWRALDSRGLHRQLKPAGMLYQAALRAELSARLGVEWGEVDRHGQAELLGVPEELRRHYSTRRAEIEVRARQRIAVAEVKHGRSLTPEERRREFETAVLETRTAKQLEDGTDRCLHSGWKAEASTVGHPADAWMGEVLDRNPTVALPELDRMVAEVLDELATSSSTFVRSDVVKALARRSPTTLTTADEARVWVEATADRVLAEMTVVRLTAPGPEVPAELRRRDGSSVFEPHGAARYSTVDTLAIEQHVLDRTIAGRDAGRAVATRADVELAIADGGLGQDQAEAVRRVTTAGEAVVCVVGPAGTGKSRTMGAAAQAWTASGIPMRGVAVSAVAAGVLQAEAGVGSDTIAKFLHEQARPDGPDPRWRLRAGEVVIVDEAGMVPTRQLAALLAHTEAVDGKLVLVGDHAQLGAVEAGGLFRLLARDSNAAELHDVRRFHEPWERAASLDLRDHDPAAICVYDDHGRVIGGDRLQLLDDAFARWQQARQAGESVVVVAADHATVDALAHRARAALVTAGEVEPEGIPIGELLVGVGDEIVTLRNDRRLVTTRDGWVRNGDRWVVQACHADGSLTVSGATGRGCVVLPGEYTAEHVTLSYALTIHKAQGVTVDHAILLADDSLSAEALYVAMTRGRLTNTALVITDHLHPDDHRAEEPASAVDLLTGVLANPTAERAALEHLRDARERSETLAVLAPRLANLDAWIAANAPPDNTPELARLERLLRQAETYARPGRLGRVHRQDRHHIQNLNEQRDGALARQATRTLWFDEHADTLTYRDELAERVATRQRDLGVDATRRRPAHLVDLIGDLPTDADLAASWTTRAGRIEAYREQWGIVDTSLVDQPHDRIQAAHWETTVGVELRTRGIEARLTTRELERSQDRELGIEL
jgi:conjugative relaxase-like TrwC/TraI family protein